MRRICMAAVGMFVLSLLATDAGAAPPSLAEAKKALELARANLAKAIEKAEHDPPAPADLDRAHEAILALKSAVDAGVSLEPTDLEYAKAALAARKEMRKQRELVDGARAKVHIHNSWRELERASSKLNELAQRAVGKDGGPKDFEAARAAADELEKLLAVGQPFATQDQKYASFLAETKDALARHRKELDDRSTAIAVDRQKTALAESRRVLDTAVAPLVTKGVSDAQFDAAERATSALSKLLQEGAALESRDKAYREYAGSAREDLKLARTRIDALWSETGLARLKAELEPLRADLVHAAQMLKTKKPAPEQLDEARTVAIVVQKLLEKFQTATARSPLALKYVGEVKDALTEVEVDLQRRSVEAAREVVNAATQALGKRGAGEEAFKAAGDAIQEAQRVLAAGARLEREDRAYQTYATDVKKRLREIESTFSARRLELEVARQRAALDTARADLTRALKNLERRAPTDGHFEEAGSAAIVLEKELETMTTKDAALAAYLREMKTLAKTSRTAIEKRRLEVELERQRARVEQGRNELARLMSSIAANNVLEERLREVETTIERIRTVLVEGAQLAAKDRAYQTYDREVRKRLDEAKAKVAARRIQLAASGNRSAIDEALRTVKSSLESAKQPEATDQDVAAASASVKLVKDTLERNLGLEKEDQGYATYALRVREGLERTDADLELAKQARAFRKATLEVLYAGIGAADAGEKASDLRAKKDKYEKAVADFKSCQTAGERMLDENEALEATRVMLQGERTTPKAILAACAKQAAAVEVELAKVLGLVAFEDGPKRSFEKGKGLLAQVAAAADKSKADALKGQALAQFEECLSSGKIVQYKNPELKDRKFEVAGAQVTLAELIAACTTEVKRLRAK
jgi:hypothetical protein